MLKFGLIAGYSSLSLLFHAVLFSRFRKKGKATNLCTVTEKIFTEVEVNVGKYLPLFTDTEVNNCFRIYQTGG